VVGQKLLLLHWLVFCHYERHNHTTFVSFNYSGSGTKTSFSSNNLSSSFFDFQKYARYWWPVPCQNLKPNNHFYHFQFVWFVTLWLTFCH
jgi:hypothetical protein